MELKDSPLWQEVKSIVFDRDSLPPIYAWKAEILANGKTVVPFKTVSMSVTRDYRTNYGDAIILEVLMPAGDFIYDVYPYRQNLLVTMSKEQRQRPSDAPTLTPDIEAQQLRATLLDEFTHSETIEGARNAVHSKEALNLMSLITVKFQLLDLALEQVRMFSIGGVFLNIQPWELVKYVLTSVSKEIPLDSTNAILGVDLIDSPNKDKYAQVVIPHGTKFADLAQFVQHKVGGLYPTGMGVYLFRQHWYVYPLYDLTRFDQTTKTLTLINIPTNQMPGVEWTYRKTANQVIALVTGDVKHHDRAEAKLLNEGNGVRYLDARRVIDGFAEPGGGDNKAPILRAENNNEYMAESRKTGLQNIVMSPTRITANKFDQLSKLSQRTGAEIMCMWENSDMGAIYPGMPVKFMYIKGEEVVELKGIVLGADHYVQTHGVGITETRHRTDTALHLFVEREQDL